MEKTHIINSLTFQMENVAKIFHNITEAYFNQEVKTILHLKNTPLWTQLYVIRILTEAGLPKHF